MNPFPCWVFPNHPLTQRQSIQPNDPTNDLVEPWSDSWFHPPFYQQQDPMDNESVPVPSELSQVGDWLKEVLSFYQWSQFPGLDYVFLALLSLTTVLASFTEPVTATLRPGDRGEDVFTLQSSLQKAGYNPGAIDGVYGKQTQQAVRQFQRDRKLLSDGIAGNQTLSKLKSGSTSMVGGPSIRKEVDVMELQQLLTNQGFFTAQINGIYGPRTHNAVRKAQQSFGLLVDGIAGPRTMAALRRSQSLTPKKNPNPIPQNLPGTTSTINVFELQDLLAEQGFFNGPKNGIYGPLTRKAVRDAQAAHGLVVDGIAGPRTMAALRNEVSATPPQGNPRTNPTPPSLLTVPEPPPENLADTLAAANTENNSLDVLYLQQLLRRNGFYQGSMDGIFGQRTRNAVSKAQRTLGLVVDGIPGPKTLQALKKNAN